MSDNIKTLKYTPPAHFVIWLEAEEGRAAYFGKVDNSLYPPLISKMKSGEFPITFEYACRLERAQKPSTTPLKAETLMTYLEDRVLYRYITGQEPAPVPVEVVRQPRTRKAPAQAEA